MLAGLTRDDLWLKETREEMVQIKAWRLQLWQNFNNCWLAVLQKQRDMSQEELDTGQKAQPPQTRISRDYLERMGNELTGLCDAVEKYGLVDYEIGVWEEQIIDREQRFLGVFK